MCSSRTPKATTRPTSARCCSPAAAPRHARRAEQLHYGLDNWIYGIIGYSGFTGTVGGERHVPPGLLPLQAGRLEAGIPPHHEQQLLGRRHQRGGPPLRLDGQRQPERLHADPESLLRDGARLAPSVLQNIADSNRFFPITDKVRQVDWHGGFTAGAGHALYTARTYPKEYWNRTAFVTEPTGHLVATFVLQPDGTDFHSHNAWNLLASDDEWTSPIMAEVGPDGNVWVIDWYNFIVQHNPTPQGFKTGKGAAYETPLRDKTHGRIYRIVCEGRQAERPAEAANGDPKELVAALRTTICSGGCTPNGCWSSGADRTSCRALIALIEDRPVDAIGLNAGAIHAIWTMHGLGVLQDSERSGGENWSPPL